MNVHSSLLPISDSLEMRGRITLLRRLLGKAGYLIFDANPDRRKTPIDIVVVHPLNPTAPYWLYPSRAGRIVVRPWVGGLGAWRLSYQHIPEEHRAMLKLIRSKPIPSKGHWYDWLSPASRIEARSLGLST